MNLIKSPSKAEPVPPNKPIVRRSTGSSDGVRFRARDARLSNSHRVRSAAPTSCLMVCLEKSCQIIDAGSFEADAHGTGAILVYA
ncbi:protein of unknown function (plasmid) [Candidatus Methylocalor cossyra]|uniref:Uncharacterized protein n=1 Tax=Candidatus Methylocalor cossyra TaxID=3108543 RepID=A0ABM9NMW5_9GAMM